MCQLVYRGVVPGRPFYIRKRPSVRGSAVGRSLQVVRSAIYKSMSVYISVFASWYGAFRQVSVYTISHSARTKACQFSGFRVISDFSLSPHRPIVFKMSYFEGILRDFMSNPDFLSKGHSAISSTVFFTTQGPEMSRQCFRKLRINTFLVCIHYPML